MIIQYVTILANWQAVNCRLETPVARTDSTILTDS